MRNIDEILMQYFRSIIHLSFHCKSDISCPNRSSVNFVSSLTKVSKSNSSNAFLCAHRRNTFKPYIAIIWKNKFYVLFKNYKLAVFWVYKKFGFCIQMLPKWISKFSLQQYLSGLLRIILFCLDNDMSKQSGQKTNRVLCQRIFSMTETVTFHIINLLFLSGKTCHVNV